MGRAPTAVRIPISRVRRGTRYNTTPYTPTAASSSSIAAKLPITARWNRSGASADARRSSIVFTSKIGRSRSTARTCSSTARIAARGSIDVRTRNAARNIRLLSHVHR
jgi:hypothetical protein